MSNFTFIDLFAGIGGIRIPFTELGGECVFSSEIDEYAVKTYAANYGYEPAGDITAIDPKTIPDHDILTGGFPCQAFSVAGKRLGFNDTRGTLFFNVAEVLDEKKPKAFLLENVKQLKTHDGGKTFATIENVLTNDLGYRVHTKILNALDYGLPQKRERTIIVGFRDDLDFVWPDPQPRVDLGPFLDPAADADPKLQASDHIKNRRQQSVITQGLKPFRPSIWHENKSKQISILPYSVALRREASHNYILVNGERLPSSRELLNLQGFPGDFRIVVPPREIRKQTGNAVPVPMIRAVAHQMMISLGWK